MIVLGVATAPRFGYSLSDELAWNDATKTFDAQAQALEGIYRKFQQTSADLGAWSDSGVNGVEFRRLIQDKPVPFLRARLRPQHRRTAPCARQAHGAPPKSLQRICPSSPRKLPTTMLSVIMRPDDRTIRAKPRGSAERISVFSKRPGRTGVVKGHSGAPAQSQNPPAERFLGLEERFRRRPVSLRNTPPERGDPSPRAGRDSAAAPRRPA